MKKAVKIIIGLVILIFVFLGVYSTYTTLISPQKWLVYKNSRYAFKIDFPPQWKLGEQELNNAGREMFSPDNKISCYAYGFENVLITDDGDPQTLDEFIKWLTKDSKIIKQSKTTLADQLAIEIVLETEDNQIKDAVYSMLDDKTGRGFFCTYENKDVRDNFQKDFRRMVKSFKNVDAKDILSFDKTNISCINLLEGTTTPLRDKLFFIDKSYTEVTITSREAWDINRLPKRVKDLENIGYICYPMPYEFEETEQETSIQAEPAVKSVEWDCELEYNDYKYLSKETINQKNNLELKGYSCEKKLCKDSKDQDSFVWLCTKERK